MVSLSDPARANRFFSGQHFLCTWSKSYAARWRVWVLDLQCFIIVRMAKYWGIWLGPTVEKVDQIRTPAATLKDSLGTIAGTPILSR